MGENEMTFRKMLAETMKRLYQRGLISIYGGNASVLLNEDNALLITPSGFNKENLREEDLVKVDFASGTALEGKPSSELKTHMSIYKANSTVRAVVHAHPTTAVGLVSAGYDFGVYTPEQAILVGKPAVIDFCMGEELAESVSGLVPTSDVVLIKNHGAFAWAPSLLEAYAKVEILEEAARMALAGMSAGGVHSFSKEEVAAIRKNYRPGR
jgi:L-fuculose-phosphate aldolase